MIKSKFEIDWLDVDLCVNHNAEKLSDGSFIYSNIYLNGIDDLNMVNENNLIFKNKPKLLSSDEGRNIQITSKNNNYINISGNIYKWLYGQNVTGESNLIKLVDELMIVMQKMNLIDPTVSQISTIKNGDYRVYRVDVKRDFIFYDKIQSLRYLDHIKKLGYFPYKNKKLYPHGAYFGIDSKTRWNMRYYHKGTELREKNERLSTNRDLYNLAERMIRGECKVLNAQLKDWNYMYGWQWANQEKVNYFFEDKFSKLKLPNIECRNEVLDIPDNNDRKFLTIFKNGCISDYYCRTTIYNKKIKFLVNYGIDLDLIERNKKIN